MGVCKAPNQETYRVLLFQTFEKISGITLYLLSIKGTHQMSLNPLPHMG